jgi:hypothetical protein
MATSESESESESETETETEAEEPASAKPIPHPEGEYLPRDWRPTVELINLAGNKHLYVSETFDAFCVHYWYDNKVRRRDWNAVARRWVENEKPGIDHMKGVS